MNAPVPAHVLPQFACAPPVPAAMLAALKARFGERCSTALAVREQHGRDESPFDAPPPEAVVFAEIDRRTSPSSSRWPTAHAVPVIPFGVGSSLEGHLLAVQGGVSIDLSRMNAIVSRATRGPDGHGAGRRDAQAAQRRDPPHGPVLPDRPRRRRDASAA